MSGTAHGVEHEPAMAWQGISIRRTFRWKSKCELGMALYLACVVCVFLVMVLHRTIGICMCAVTSGRELASMWHLLIVTTPSTVTIQTAWISWLLLDLCLLPSCIHVIMHETLVFHSLRLALFSCLMLAPGCMGLMGPDCSSWGAPNLGTTLRSQLNNAFGFECRWNVRDGNMTVSRLLGMDISHACMGKFGVAHPIASGLCWFALLSLQCMPILWWNNRATPISSTIFGGSGSKKRSAMYLACQQEVETYGYAYIYYTACTWSSQPRSISQIGGWWPMDTKHQNDNAPGLTGMVWQDSIWGRWLLQWWNQRLLSKLPILNSGCVDTMHVAILLEYQVGQERPGLATKIWKLQGA